jgi:hypothetical protein
MTTPELQVLFGNDWVPLPVNDEGDDEAQAASLARKAGGSHYVIVSDRTDAMLGIASGQLGAHARLAGQLLASVVNAASVCYLTAANVTLDNPFRTRSLLFVGPHGAGYCAVGVLHGVPVLDRVGTLDEVLAECKGYTSNVLEGGALLLAEGGRAALEPLSRSAPAACHWVPSLPFDSRWAQHTLAPRPIGVSRRHVALVAVTVVGVVALGSTLGYRHYAQKKAIEAAEVLAAASMADAKADIGKMQASAFATAPATLAGPAARMVFDFARKLLDERAGFAADRLRVAPDHTQLLYTRPQRRSTFAEFVTQSDEGTAQFVVSKLDQAGVQYAPLPWHTLPHADLSKPSPAAHVLLDLATLAQRIEHVGVKLNIVEPAPLLSNEQLTRLDATTRATLAVRVGTWSATGPAALLAEMAGAMPAEACTLSQVEIVFGKNTEGTPTDSFFASGRYVVSWS